MTIARRLATSGLLLLALSACGKPPLRSDTVTSDGSAAPAAPVPTASPSAADAGGLPDAGEAPAAVASTAPVEDAGAPPPLVADNKVAPTEGQELQERAKGLFEAIVKDEPERADPFWFPKEPFIPLKDVKDPGKYWNELHRLYVSDVHVLHKKRKSWEGAEYVSFDGWSHPKWVPPGDEANKIGYHRAFHGKIHYRAGGEDGEIDVHTIITWQGRWYVTHLRKIKH